MNFIIFALYLLSTINLGQVAAIVVSLLWALCILHCIGSSWARGSELIKLEEALRASQEAFMRECKTTCKE